MKKILFFVGACLLGLGMTKAYSDAIPNEARPNGMSFTTITSSGQVFVGAGTLYRMALSTGNGSDFTVAFDTVYAANANPLVIPAAQQLTPSMVFYATGTVQQVLDIQPYGVYVKNGLFIFNNTLVNETNVGYKK